MADLTYIDRDLEVKIVGQDSTGNSVNYVGADVNGNIKAILPSDGPVTPGTAAGSASLIGGQFNTALPTLTNTQQAAIQVDSSGRIIIAPLTTASTISVQQTDNTTATYSASAITFTLAAAATDVFVIQGSGTKTIKITRLEFAVTTTAGSGALISASWIKRSGANTGASTVATNTPHDSNNAAATATVTFYTANPSVLGASVGAIRAIRAEAYNTSTAPTYTIWTFGDRPGQAIYLRGTSQYLALNFGGATVTNGIACINIEWTEV